MKNFLYFVMGMVAGYIFYWLLEQYDKYKTNDW